jgi:HD-GYP domain-containing protein (c-di-GMP phosphodiesterase class II)
LAGVEIPLAGRIVAVADVWDAITSDRAYRPAWPFDRAISHIAAGGGTLFDPLCVEAFLDLLEEAGLVPEKTRADVEALFRDAIERHSVSEPGAGTTASRPSGRS